MIGPREQYLGSALAGSKAGQGTAAGSPNGLTISKDGSAARFLVIYGVDPLGSSRISAYQDLNHAMPTLLGRARLSGAKVFYAGDPPGSADARADAVGPASRRPGRGRRRAPAAHHVPARPDRAALPDGGQHPRPDRLVRPDHLRLLWCGWSAIRELSWPSGTSNERTMNASIRTPANSRKARWWKDCRSTRASAAKLQASARAATEMARAARGTAVATAPRMGRMRACSQMRPTRFDGLSHHLPDPAALRRVPRPAPEAKPFALPRRLGRPARAWPRR